MLCWAVTCKELRGSPNVRGVNLTRASIESQVQVRWGHGYITNPLLISVAFRSLW